MKEGELSQEERTAQMKAALYESLKWQQWLNKAADKAAIAGRHEPPSSQPWRKRFRCAAARAGTLAWCRGCCVMTTTEPAWEAAQC